MLTSGQNKAFSYTEISRVSAKTLLEFSMCVAKSKFIYVTGGCSYDGKSVYANCHRYDIDRNLWQEMQSMNKPRYFHSSCQLAACIYVFCGKISDYERINSVEKLYIDTDPNL